MLRRYREAGGFALGRPALALIQQHTFNSSRAIRWFSCESYPASARAVFKLGRRVLDLRSSRRKSGASEPMPVRALPARIRCERVSMLKLSLGVRRAERERRELACFFSLVVWGPQRRS